MMADSGESSMTESTDECEEATEKSRYDLTRIVSVQNRKVTWFSHPTWPYLGLEGYCQYYIEIVKVVIIMCSGPWELCVSHQLTGKNTICRSGIAPCSVPNSSLIDTFAQPHLRCWLFSSLESWPKQNSIDPISMCPIAHVWNSLRCAMYCSRFSYSLETG